MVFDSLIIIDLWSLSCRNCCIILRQLICLFMCTTSTWMIEICTYLVAFGLSIAENNFSYSCLISISTKLFLPHQRRKQEWDRNCSINKYENMLLWFMVKKKNWLLTKLLYWYHQVDKWCCNIYKYCYHISTL